MTDLRNRYVVYEGIFNKRFVAARVTGETRQFWRVRKVHPRTKEETPERRLKKSGVRFLSAHENPTDALRAAAHATEEFGELAQRHMEEVKGLYLAHTSREFEKEK